MRKTFKKNQGITLIALVVTIIVLLILAGIAISMISGNNGILTKATDAKKANEQGIDEDKIKLATQTALIKGFETNNGKIDKDTLVNELIASGIISSESELTKDGTIYTVTKNGITYTISENGLVAKKAEVAKWHFTNDMKITNGTQVLELGDSVNYNAKVDENGNEILTSSLSYTSPLEKNGNSNQTISAENNLTWRILGIDNGQVIITTDQIVNLLKLSKYDLSFYGSSGDNATDIDYAYNAYQFGPDEIKNSCKIYGLGRYADLDKSRSIQDKDINVLTGYNKESFVQHIDNFQAQGDISYGQRIDFYWDGTKYLNIVWGNENSLKLVNENNYIRLFNSNNALQKIPYSTTATVSNKEYAGYIIDDYYSYDLRSNGRSAIDEPDSLVYSEYANNIMGINTNIYNLLFPTTGNYWLANKCIECNGWVNTYEIRIVRNGGEYYSSLGCVALVDSLNELFGEEAGIKPVVVLKSDVTFTENGNNNWNLGIE